MNLQHLQSFLAALPQFLILIPSTVLCYLPMRGQLRVPVRRLLALCGGAEAAFSCAAAWACAATGVDANLLLYPAMVGFFLAFRHTVRAGFSQCLTVFVGTCALTSFPSHFAMAFDAWLHPDGLAANFSPQAALFQFGLSCVMTLLLYRPYRRLYAWVIDHLSAVGIWNQLAGVHFIFLALNTLVIPLDYRTLYVGRVYRLYVIIEGILLALLLFMQWFMARMALVLTQHAELQERSRLLEIQAGQYQSLRSHMRQTSRLRHDFRQSVHILSALANEGDMESLRSHLRDFEQQLGAGEHISYCANAALNALFNYYREMAAANHVDIDWKLDLPEPLTFSELDLASLFGNLMENAIDGCAGVPEGERYFKLVTEVRQGGQLYIISTNPFDGNPHKGPEGYLSTKHSGKGLGLASITAVAEKYGGSARFSHSGREFFVDVFLRS